MHDWSGKHTACLEYSPPTTHASLSAALTSPRPERSSKHASLSLPLPFASSAHHSLPPPPSSIPLPSCACTGNLTIFEAKLIFSWSRIRAVSDYSARAQMRLRNLQVEKESTKANTAKPSRAPLALSLLSLLSPLPSLLWCTV